jgi:hypothetical protein
MTESAARSMAIRRRQRSRAMQAEVDGHDRAEVGRVLKLPFIEPARAFAVEKLVEERKDRTRGVDPFRST